MFIYVNYNVWRFALQCEVAGTQIQQNHLKKIINMQEKRLEDHQSSIDILSKICSEYHMILRGRDLVTDSMDNEYQVPVPFTI